MAKQLPARPNLDQLKNQAKDLLKAYKAADPAALARIRRHLPRLAHMSDAEMAKARFVLQDAQHAIAREMDFSSWDSLATALKESFESITELSDREIQTLLREVEQRDLVVALVGSTDALNEKILGNMSARVRIFIEEELRFISSDVTQEEIDAVQMRIIATLARQADQGQITWPARSPLKKKPVPPRPRRLPKAYLAAKDKARQTAQQPLAALDLNTLNAFFTSLAEIARREGILALEEVGGQAADPFLRLAICLAVDGTQPQLINDMLQEWMASLLREQEVKYRKVTEGIMAIQSGDNPRIVEHKLAVIF